MRLNEKDVLLMFEHIKFALKKSGSGEKLLQNQVAAKAKCSESEMSKCLKAGRALLKAEKSKKEVKWADRISKESAHTIALSFLKLEIEGHNIADLLGDYHTLLLQAQSESKKGELVGSYIVFYISSNHTIHKGLLTIYPEKTAELYTYDRVEDQIFYYCGNYNLFDIKKNHVMISIHKKSYDSYNGKFKPSSDDAIMYHLIFDKITNMGVWIGYRDDVSPIHKLRLTLYKLITFKQTDIINPADFKPEIYSRSDISKLKKQIGEQSNEILMPKDEIALTAAALDFFTSKDEGVYMTYSL
ncbi:MAG: hypothetical protein V4543_07405 [Bacteroidota bacterium]